MTVFHLPSPAKINLFLHVVGRRADGYHLLQTAFQFINFYDELSFKIRNDSSIGLTSPNMDVPPEENLIFKAATTLQSYTNCKLGVDITLTKRIPLGSGLGGGSSNAATTLMALNKLWQTGLSGDELIELGVKLGADVPIFIYGQAAFAEGIGERFEAIHPPENWILLLMPDCKVDTGKIFSDSELTRTTPQITIRTFFETGGHNDCEPIARKYFPQIAQALDLLSQYSTARMTGTGSGVFATFNDKEAALKVAKKIPASLNGIIVKGLNSSPLHNTIRKNWGVAKR